MEIKIPLEPSHFYHIHSNPVKDRLADKIEHWEYSSYKPLLYSNDTFLNKGITANQLFRGLRPPEG